MGNASGTDRILTDAAAEVAEAGAAVAGGCTRIAEGDAAAELSILPAVG
jgi:hypothetical protein